MSGCSRARRSVLSARRVLALPSPRGALRRDRVFSSRRVRRSAPQGVGADREGGRYGMKEGMVVWRGRIMGAVMAAWQPSAFQSALRRTVTSSHFAGIRGARGRRGVAKAMPAWRRRGRSDDRAKAD